MKTFSKYKIWLILALVAFVALPLLWLVYTRLEGVPPALSTAPAVFSTIGASEKFTVIADDASGIRMLRISLHRDGKEILLADKTFPSSGFGRSGKARREAVALQVEPEKLDLKDGRVVLKVTARDYSWRHWGNGNTARMEKALLIDTTPPDADVLTRMNYINQGGCGLVIYRLSESCPETGVFAGENFFPGYAGHFADENIYMAFFALGHGQGQGTPLFIQSTDRAGNRSRTGFPHVIRPKRFRKDRLTISDGFLNMKMPEFDVDVPGNAKPTNLEKYIHINRHLRDANYKELLGIMANARRTMSWKGAFLRLPNSAPRAGYADFREYFHNGKKIDEQIHMGIDLASVAHSPVPVGNSGRVAYAGDLGIYGRTVLIDHGYGLFSMYSHLSRIDAEAGKTVAKGDIIGSTGTTGLAGGDHLHYAVAMHGIFVNPIEWWDGHWIRDNITRKIDMVKSEYNRG